MDGSSALAGASFSGLAIAGRVGFVAKVLPAPDATQPAAPALDLLSRLLSRHIHRLIRLEGGAYGGVSRYDPEEGLLLLASWRDPAIASTLRVFDAAGDFLRCDGVTDEALDEVRVDSIQDFDSVLSPAKQLATARVRHFSQLPEGPRMAYREALYTLGADDIRRLVVADVVLALADAPTMVIAPQEHLGAAGVSSNRRPEQLGATAR